MKDKVIILHGLRKTSRHMRKISRYLQKQNFDVLNLDYPSHRFDLNYLCEFVYNQISEHSKNHRLHFVGYSMGGILIRMMLARYNFNLGNIVLIGVPNRGCRIVDFFGNNFFYKKYFGPAGCELSEKNLVENAEFYFGNDDKSVQIGSIAGVQKINFLSHLLLGTIENDGTVSVESTKFSGSGHHLILKSSHLFLPVRKKVIRQVAHFIGHGVFLQN